MPSPSRVCRDWILKDVKQRYRAAVPNPDGTRPKVLLMDETEHVRQRLMNEAQIRSWPPE